jgi:hypothetical protein
MRMKKLLPSGNVVIVGRPQTAPSLGSLPRFRHGFPLSPFDFPGRREDSPGVWYIYGLYYLKGASVFTRYEYGPYSDDVSQDLVNRLLGVLPPGPPCLWGGDLYNYVVRPNLAFAVRP